ncbi:MAG: hypothetical protein Q7J80_17425, partial [Anaerolineales bacterium]|nr:hypothetical protein [Anaerolineales bacterium]
IDPANDNKGPDNQGTRETNMRENGRSLLPQINALRAAYPSSKLVFLIIPYTPSFRPIPGDSASWTDSMDHTLATVLNEIDGGFLVYTLKSFQELYGATHILPRGTFNSAFNYGHLNQLGHQVVAGDLIPLLEAILK